MNLKYFLADVYSVCWRELKHFTQQKARVIMTVIQPLIWLALMGNMMSGLTSNPYAAKMLGVSNYLDFMTPGIMIMKTLFGGIFGGVSILWDRRFGFLNKMLSSPINRSAIPLGKVVAIVVQNGIQVLIVILIALLLGVRFVTGLWGILFMLVFAALFGSIMASISLTLATVVKSQEALFAIINFFTMPLMFTSNALFPKEAMPGWLATVAAWNPVSYAVAPMRSLTTQGWNWSQIGSGLAFLVVVAGVIMTLSIRRFSKSVA